MAGESGDGLVLLGVLGFDEKFLARCVMRNFAGGRLRRVVVLVPEPTREVAEKVGRARESLEKLVREYVEVDIEFLEVPRGSFKAAFHAARRAMAGALEGGSSLVICLSGGMRYTLLALIAAALSLRTDYPTLPGSRVEVDLESGEGHVSLGLAQLRVLASLDPVEVKALEGLWEAFEEKGGPVTLTELEQRTGLARSTLWRALTRMAAAGLVEREGRRGGFKPLFPPP